MDQKQIVGDINSLMPRDKKIHVFRAKAKGNQIEIFKITSNQNLGSFTLGQAYQWLQDQYRQGYGDGRYANNETRESRSKVPMRKQGNVLTEAEEKEKLQAQERMAKNKALPRTVTMRGQGKPKTATQ